MSDYRPLCFIIKERERENTVAYDRVLDKKGTPVKNVSDEKSGVNERSVEMSEMKKDLEDRCEVGRMKHVMDGEVLRVSGSNERVCEMANEKKEEREYVVVSGSRFKGFKTLKGPGSFGRCSRYAKRVPGTKVVRFEK